MSIKKLTPSFTFTEDRLAELRAVVPEAFADGKINWETLREALGDYMEEEGQNAESFGLSWPGKRQARRLAAMPSKGTLKPMPGEGVDESTTRNLFIEGDNLEVLKLLQKSYAGRVKMIYIDPPYNTGNDFVYKDDFKEPLEDYLRKTGQMGETGDLLTSNPKASGRFHSSWLNMMFPRLVLAKTLLRGDGLLFVSIDDNEVHNLKMLLNEIMGEEKFLAQIVWKNVYGGGAKSKYVVAQHEYILCYANNLEELQRIELPPDPDARKRYTERDSKYDTRGPYFTQPLATTSMDPRPNLRYPILWKGEEIWPEKQWQWSRDKVERALANDDLVIRRDSGKWSVRYKQYLFDDSGTERGAKLASVLNGPWTQEGTAEIEEFFGDGKTFPFPKPSSLIKHCISAAWQDPNAIVLDFFAGSCPTAQAVLELNREYELNQRFILVQVPQPIDHPKYSSIADIGRERIRRVIKKLTAETKGKLKFDKERDHGFRAFKLTRSNYRAWQDYAGDDAAELEDLFSQAQHPLVDGWNPNDVLAETMLLEGFPLDSTVSERKGFKKNRVQIVESDACAHRLVVCLDPLIYADTTTHLDLGADDVFVCLDSALSDGAKVRLADVVKLHVI